MSSSPAITPPAPILKLFQRLAPRVVLYTPPAANGSVIQPNTGGFLAPDMIIFMAWMNARPRHIEKYIKVHMNLNPTSQILIMTITDVDFLFSSEAKRRSQMEAGVSAILNLKTVSVDHAPRLLVHIFSNGGAKRFWGLAEMYKERSPTHSILPVSAIVYDSSPGFPRFWMTIHVLMQAAPKNFILRFLFGVYIYSLSAWLSFIVNFTPFCRNLAHNPTIGTNDPATINPKAPRCYIYSEKDEAVGVADVEKHAATAENMGFPVMRFPVKGSGHVQHVLKHDKVYWEMVQKTWEAGVKNNA